MPEAWLQLAAYQRCYSVACRDGHIALGIQATLATRRPQGAVGVPHTARLAAHVGAARPGAYPRHAQHGHALRPVQQEIQEITNRTTLSRIVFFIPLAGALCHQAVEFPFNSTQRRISAETSHRCPGCCVVVSRFQRDSREVAHASQRGSSSRSRFPA